MQIKREEIMPGVYLTGLQTDKFKTGLISVSFLTRLCRENASQNALIPGVLRRGTVHYPDMTALAARLNSLYGARLEPVVRKRGEIQCVGFWADFVDDVYLPDKDEEGQLAHVAALLGEVLLSPNTCDGMLLPAYVEGEKEKLLENIRARINDKTSYSTYRLTELMCQMEDFAVDVLGTEDTAENIRYTSLTEHYRKLLATSPVEIFYCGREEFDRAAHVMKKALGMLPRGEIDYDIGTDIRMNALEDHVRYYQDVMDVGQGKLAIGYRLGSCMENPNIAAIHVMNIVFGGGVSSKLFTQVREKLNLCYYISSGVDTMKGIMYVVSGIEPQNYDVAMQAIERLLQDVKEGNISEEELAVAKLTFVSSLRGLMDSAGQMESFWQEQNIQGLDYGPEELAEMAEMVTLEDVVEVAAGIECDAVYFLRNGGEG